MITNQDGQLEALGDATRRTILARLRKGPMPVGRLAQGFAITRPAISQHLKVLKAAGLVVDQVRGTQRMYQLNPAAFASLRDYFEEFWDVALSAFAKRVEDRKHQGKDGDHDT